MKTVPNDIVQNFIRHLPLILDNMNEKAIKRNVRLNNAVRLTKISIKRLEKIENENNYN